MQTNSLRHVLNRAILGTLATVFHVIGIGDVLRQDVKQEVRGAIPAASPAQLATLWQVGLNDIGRAASVVRAFSRAGTVTGELTIVKYGVTPATGECSVAPNGDIVVLAADAITKLDVVYMPEAGEVIEVSLPVVSDSMAIPAYITSRGVINVIDANVTTGTVTGRKIIKAAGATPGAGQCALGLTGAALAFHTGIGATQATVRFLVARKTTLTAALDADSNFV